MTMEHVFRRLEAFHNVKREKGAGFSAIEPLRQLIIDLVHFSSANPQLHNISTQDGGQFSLRFSCLSDHKGVPSQFPLGVPRSLRSVGSKLDSGTNLFRSTRHRMAGLIGEEKL